MYFIYISIDCQNVVVSAGLAARFQVGKYPTLKMFRFGQPIKREYRGQRSPEAIAEFVKELLKNPVTSVNSLDQLDNIDVRRISLNSIFCYKN